MSSEGTPLHGDRSAWNVMDFDTEHGKDIDDSTLRRHLPLPGAVGGYARSDGTDWQRVNSLALADIAGYSRGYIIRGGSSDWEAYDANNTGFILVGDGTDIASIAFDWDTMATGSGADMVHDHSSAGEGGNIAVGAISDIATTYLKLDASNDPVTGDLTLTPTANSITTLDVNQSDGTAVFDVDTTNRKVVVTSGTTGQSTIEAGLIVNNASGNAAIDDFQVNSDTLTAILVDASADTVTIAANLSIAIAAVGDDGRGLSSISHLAASGKSDGIAAYFEGHIDNGVTTDGVTYGTGAWLNVDSGATTSADIRALDIGIYESGADCSGGNAYGLAIHMEFDDTNPPAAIYPFRINCNDTASHATPDALIFAPNRSAIALTDAAPGAADAYLKIKLQDGSVYRMMLVKE